MCSTFDLRIPVCATGTFRPQIFRVFLFFFCGEVFFIFFLVVFQAEFSGRCNAQGMNATPCSCCLSGIAHGMDGVQFLLDMQRTCYGFCPQDVCFAIGHAMDAMHVMLACMQTIVDWHLHIS